MVILKGRTVILRSVKQSDLKLFRDWRNSADIWQNNTQFVLLNLKQQNSWFDGINSPNGKEEMFTIINEKQKKSIYNNINYYKSIIRSAIKNLG